MCLVLARAAARRFRAPIRALQMLEIRVASLLHHVKGQRLVPAVRAERFRTDHVLALIVFFCLNTPSLLYVIHSPTLAPLSYSP